MSFDREVKNHPIFDKEFITEMRQKIAKGTFIARYFDQLRDGTLPEKDVKFTLGVLRAYRLHPYIPDVIQFLKTHPNNEKQTILTLEALSWFKDSNQKSLIKSYCKQILVDNTSSDEIKYQAQRTLSILN